MTLWFVGWLLLAPPAAVLLVWALLHAHTLAQMGATMFLVLAAYVAVGFGALALLVRGRWAT